METTQVPPLLDTEQQVQGTPHGETSFLNFLLNLRKTGYYQATYLSTLTLHYICQKYGN